MTTYVVTDYDGWDGITAGKRYRIISNRNESFCILDDDGKEALFGTFGNRWTVIEEPDTPKTWGEMTDAEKGALLLHEYRNGSKSIQYSIPEHEGDKSWGEKMMNEGFIVDWIYRIKPEPVVGEVVMTGFSLGAMGYVFGGHEGTKDTHTITLPTLDGKLVMGEFANEDGMKVVIEEKQK